MRRTRLFWGLLSACLLISLAALLVLGGAAARRYRESALSWTEGALEAQATLLAELAAGRLAPDSAPGLNRLCKELGRRSGTRLTIVRADGTVACDSEGDPRSMGPHGDRPEIAAALAGQVGRATRYSPTLHRRLQYVAVPVPDRGAAAAERPAPAGAARASLAEETALRGLGSLERDLLLGWLLLAALAAGTAAAESRRIAGPLARLRSGIGRLADGRQEGRLGAEGPAEVAALAEALNAMAAALDERLRAMLREREEQEAVLLSMMEGVLAVDGEERILRLNEAAARLLRVDRERAEGRPLQEVVRNVELQGFVGRVLAGRAPQEGELVLREGATGAELFMQAHGTVLHGDRGRAIGALVVLNDVTRLRRLENVRREFVANVSHELKTPITSIKGFVETLLEGAYKEPADALHFLGIVAQQADRLNAIIKDLLVLSRLEQEEHAERPAMSDQEVRPVLEAAVQACAALARERDVPVSLSCAADLTARMSPPLMEQAVVNLIENAIKYCDPGRPVRVEAGRGRQGLEIRVADEGVGIAPEHLPRLFERFYRVDKGRSRKQGGTGLGLAIVKHIVRAHGGTVEVESSPGAGSVFTIRLG